MYAVIRNPEREEKRSWEESICAIQVAGAGVVFQNWWKSQIQEAYELQQKWMCEKHARHIIA